MDLKSSDGTSDEEFDIFCQHSRKLSINSLPYQVLQHILRYFSFAEIAKLRLVSKLFNEICGGLLNSEFHRLKLAVQVRYAYVKSQMPRRESSRRKHVLSRENDIVETLHMRMALLSLTIGKHVERNHCCFFAGEVLDEINRLLEYVKNTAYLNRPFKVTDELLDLTSMAVEYFKEYIEPTLPEVIYFTDFSGNSLANADNVPGSTVEPTPSLGELNEALEDTRRVVYKNQVDINAIKSSIKLFYKNIDNLESIVHQIMQKQNDYKEIQIPKSCLNELLFQLNQCSLMIDSFKSRLPDSQRKGELPYDKQVHVSSSDSETAESYESLSDPFKNNYNSVYNIYEDNSLYSASTSQNVDCENANIKDFQDLNYKNMTVYNKRKCLADIFVNIIKKRKT